MVAGVIRTAVAEETDGPAPPAGPSACGNATRLWTGYPRKANPTDADIVPKGEARYWVSSYRGHNCRTCFIRGRLGALHGR
jgi:hypothetical protein